MAADKFWTKTKQRYQQNTEDRWGMWTYMCFDYKTDKGASQATKSAIMHFFVFLFIKLFEIAFPSKWKSWKIVDGRL